LHATIQNKDAAATDTAMAVGDSSKMTSAPVDIAKPDTDSGD
jgi:hypothetical protein